MEKNLIEAMFSEINRVRGLIVMYEDPILKGAGKFAATTMKVGIELAELSIEEGDVAKMVIAYNNLRGYKC